jgi:hypothetical protein
MIAAGRRVLFPYLLAGLLGIAGCGGGGETPPVLVPGESVCAECGMTVGDLRFTAASRTEKGEAVIFDDPGCLIRHLRRAGAGAGGPIWLAAYDEEGNLHSREEVTLVAADFPSPMASGFAAFLDPERAREEARLRDGVEGTLEAFVSGAVQPLRSGR